MALWRRFLNVLRPARLDRELNEELEFHREMRLRRSRERGLSVAEAEDETRRRMGNLLLAKEEMREARMVRWLASSLQDLRHGLVLLRRDPEWSGTRDYTGRLGREVSGNLVLAVDRVRLLVNEGART